MTKQERIKQACRKAYGELTELGKRPTVNAVSSLVTGDRNAISKALKELREEYEVDGDGRSTRLPTSVTRAMELVYLDLKGSIEDESLVKIKAAQDTLENAITQKSLLEEELASVKQELDSLKDKYRDKKIELGDQNSLNKKNDIELARLGTLRGQQQQQIALLQLNNKEMLSQIESERVQTRHQITHMLEQGRELKDEKDAVGAKHETLKYQYREYRMDTSQSLKQLEADLARQAQEHQQDLSELTLSSQKALISAESKAQAQAQERQDSLKDIIQEQLKVINKSSASIDRLETEVSIQRQKELEMKNGIAKLESSLAMQEENNHALLKIMKGQEDRAGDKGE